MPFFLSKAVGSLLPAGGDGQTILATAVWIGALATKAEAALDYETVKLMASGRATRRNINSTRSISTTCSRRADN